MSDDDKSPIKYILIGDSSTSKIITEFSTGNPSQKTKKEINKIFTKLAKVENKKYDERNKIAAKDNLDYNLSFSELVSILNKVREELNETAKKSVNYKSYGAYTFDTCKHRCAGGDPNVVFKSPVTKGMTYGFYNFKSQNLNDIRRPIIKCPETKYAESLVMAGVGKF